MLSKGDLFLERGGKEDSSRMSILSLLSTKPSSMKPYLGSMSRGGLPLGVRFSRFLELSAGSPLYSGTEGSVLCLHRTRQGR